MAFDINSIFGKDSALGSLANSYVSSLGGNKNQPKPLVIQAPAAPAAAPASSGMDSKTMMMIGGGVLALVAVIAFAMRK